MKKEKFNLKIVILIMFAALIPILITGLVSARTPAEAASYTLTAQQVSTVQYNGEDYIYNGMFVGEEGENELFASIKFFLNGGLVEVPMSAVKSSLSTARLPINYRTDLVVDLNGGELTCELEFTIAKKDLRASALVNGKSYCEVKEGEDYTVDIVYEGFVSGDNVSSLDSPMLIDSYPKMPTSGTGYRIIPKYGSSEIYNIIPVPATVVIVANPDRERRYENSEGVTELLLSGSFSPYYELQYREIGVNEASSDYVAVKEKLDRYYGNNRLFEEYNEADVYRINMLLDGNIQDLTDPVTISIKLPDNLVGLDSYRIIHFANDGSYTLITNVAANGGYLAFNSVGLGDYVLLTPIEGTNIILTIAISVGIILGVVFIVLLFAVFRRKY